MIKWLKKILKKMFSKKVELLEELKRINIIIQGAHKRIYIYIDESSGVIHKNSHTKYFAVSGYCVLEQDKMKVTAKY